MKNSILMKNALTELVRELADEYATEYPKYNLRIEYWHISPETGEKVVHSIDKWVIDEEDLFDHIKRAKRLNDATISVNATHIVVERKGFSGEQGITATYTPEVA